MPTGAYQADDQSTVESISCCPRTPNTAISSSSCSCAAITDDALAMQLGCLDISRISVPNSFAITCDGRYRCLNQDRVVLHDTNDVRIMAVFDGHGSLGENAALVAATMISPLIISKKSLSDALLDIHALLVSIAEHEHKRDPLWPYDYGTTAAVAKIASDYIDLAWIGDSRIAIFEENARTRIWSWQWSSRDHNPRTNDAEVERLIQADAKTIDHGGVRIFPGQIMGIDDAIRQKLTLNMSRALGHRVLSNHGVLATPEVATRRLSQTRATCIVCASDGIWDVLDERDVALILTETLQVGERLAAETIVSRSDQEWIRECSGDNMSVVVSVIRPTATASS